MKKLLFIPLIGLFASCKSTYTSTLSTPTHAPKAIINPLRAEVDVDINKKLTGEAQATYFLFIRLNGDRKQASGLNFSSDPTGLFSKPSLYRRLKSAAAYKAVTESKSDLIVHPNYVIEKHNFLFFSNVKMKVTGYAGTFKKFYQEPYDDKDKKVDLKLDIKAN